MFKRILVPTDFSENAQHALEVATDLAKKIDAEVILLKVIDVSSIAQLKQFAEKGKHVQEVTKEFKNVMYHAALNGLIRLKKSVAHKALAIATEVVFGENLKEILNGVLDLSYDLVVVGKYRGQDGVSNLFDVSTRGKLIHLVECPVLIVNNKVQNFDPQTIVFATQLKKESLVIVNQLKNFQSVLGSSCHLLYVDTPTHLRAEDKVKESLDAFIDKFGVHDWESVIYSSKTVEGGVLGYAQKVKADLITVYAENSNWIYRLFLGGFPTDAIAKADVPVLVYTDQ